MTGGAIFRRRLVEQNRFGGDYLCDFMTVVAPYSLVRTTERKRRTCLMIKKRRLPFHAVVALGTTGDIALGELLSVDVLMAVFTLRGRSLEVGIQKLGLEIRRPMTADTRCSPMRSQQRKLCFRMIKP